MWTQTKSLIRSLHIENVNRSFSVVFYRKFEVRAGGKDYILQVSLASLKPLIIKIHIWQVSLASLKPLARGHI